MPKQKRKSTPQRKNSRDFVKMWAQKFYIATKQQYFVKWQKHILIMHRLQGTYKSKQLTKIIDFVFSGAESMDYIKQSGYPIELLPNMVNKCIVEIENGPSIKTYELELDTPYWDDERTSYLFSRIKTADLPALIKNVKQDFNWNLLLAKIEQQAPDKEDLIKRIKFFRKMWENGETFNRTPLKSCKDCKIKTECPHRRK